MMSNSVMSNSRYYTLAHAVNEVVVRQPSMLQAGTLRDYQLVSPPSILYVVAFFSLSCHVLMVSKVFCSVPIRLDYNGCYRCIITN